MDTSRLQDIKHRYNIVGNCDALNRALDVALQIAPTDLSVLIAGESGVGKEILPRIIHENSPRKKGNYIAINCGAIPQGTIDSELFGHEKGAFTSAIGESQGYFGATSGGTLFLDEVGELPLATQARLLRVLETGEYIRVGGQKVLKTDVRIVAATNVNLPQAIKEGKFRQDLYYRLNAVPIQMPPLRERGEDIERLFRMFALQMSEKYRMPRVELTPEAKQILLNYKWPGNVRELKNITERISVLSESRIIDEQAIRKFIPVDPESTGLVVIDSQDSEGNYANEREMLWKVIVEMKNTVDTMKADMKGLRTQLNEQRGLAGARGFDTPIEEPAQTFSGPMDSAATSITTPPASHEFLEAEEVHDTQSAEESLNLREISEQALLRVLEKHNGNRKKAAEELGISDRTLYRRLDALGISRKRK